MTDSIQLKYGERNVEVPLMGRYLGAFEPQPIKGLARPEDVIRECLKEPIGSPPLRTLAAQARSAAILVSGRDRTTGSDVYVSLLADELNLAGIADERITVYLATGTHAKQSEEDRIAILGSEAFQRLTCVQHDPRDREKLLDFGTTPLGTPILINRAVAESDVKILTGRITHHYFAGFSGGRKAIAPGVSGFETILANHKRVLRLDGLGRHPGVRAGNLNGNPVHLDMLNIAKAADPTFCLNTVLNLRHEITHVFAGDYVRAHLAGCSVVESIFRRELPRKATIAIASCGGWPYDISFMQVIKTIVAAEAAVVDGGVLVVLGKCERGLENGFLEWFKYPSLEELNRAVLADYNLKGHNSLWIREIQARVKVVLVSHLPPELVAALGFLPASNVGEAMAVAYELAGPDPQVMSIPYGNVTHFA